MTTGGGWLVRPPHGLSGQDKVRYDARLRGTVLLADLPMVDRVLAEATTQALASAIHGPDHWARVAQNARAIAAADESVALLDVLTFAVLHDAFRVHDGGDRGHGERAASWLRANGDHVGDIDLERLAYALVWHDRGRVSEEPTIGACWDADRLDLPRVGLRVQPDLLSTDTARAILARRSL